MQKHLQSHITTTSTPRSPRHINLDTHSQMPRPSQASTPPPHLPHSTIFHTNNPRESPQVPQQYHDQAPSPKPIQNHNQDSTPTGYSQSKRCPLHLLPHPPLSLLHAQIQTQICTYKPSNLPVSAVAERPSSAADVAATEEYPGFAVDGKFRTFQVSAR
jgi:hypothetical protein